MKYTIDARGLACPLPVVQTKNKMKEVSEGDVVEVIVDNDIARQNLEKFAQRKQYTYSSSKEGNDYIVLISQGEIEECTVCGNTNDQVVVISSQTMGEGNDELGKSLMKAFVFALTKQDILPGTILLYNGGAHLTCTGSDCLEDFKYLESQGTQIMTCGTCLNFYGIQDTLEVGGVTNMYDIVETMSLASLIIKP